MSKQEWRNFAPLMSLRQSGACLVSDAGHAPDSSSTGVPHLHYTTRLVALLHVLTWPPIVEATLFLGGTYGKDTPQTASITI